ncbi:MAG TPA: VOC family protein [Paracoccaceae bacterium]|nr:VOC family protein [Paracoccaceae bacterium]
MLTLDHLAVAAATLEDGRIAVEDALGVALQTGGQHAHFGTHNLLLGLEDGLYLEVIAVDPAAGDPGRARWFDLDRFAGAPRLANWICRCEDLEAALAAAPEGSGAPVAFSRGDLRWRMAVAADGRVPFDGAFPALIEWQGAHPAARLAPSGCRLRRLVIAHPEAAALRAALAPVLNDARVVVEPGPHMAMMAEFDTPTGVRVLR